MPGFILTHVRDGIESSLSFLFCDTEFFFFFFFEQAVGTLFGKSANGEDDWIVSQKIIYPELGFRLF